MAHRLIAAKTLYKTKVAVPLAVRGVSYDVWVTPNGYGKWNFRFNLTGQPGHIEECDLKAAEYIFGHEKIEKHFGLAYKDGHVFFARSTRKDEEDIL